VYASLSTHGSKTIIAKGGTYRQFLTGTPNTA